jgi:hypothetical protein
MFRRALLIAVALLVVSGGLLTYLMVRPSETDLVQYEEVLRKARPEEMTAALHQPGQQERRVVYKDLWIVDGDERLHFQLACDTSTLEFDVEGSRSKIIEHMRGVKGIIQEKLYTDDKGQPMQELRYLVAEEASYDYHTNRFVAGEATLTRFRTTGHDMIDSTQGLEPIITGTARSAEFTLADGGIDFKAHHLKAKIYTQRGI